jgi:hypothetical protein
MAIFVMKQELTMSSHTSILYAETKFFQIDILTLLQRIVGPFDKTRLKKAYLKWLNGWFDEMYKDADRIILNINALTPEQATMHLNFFKRFILKIRRLNVAIESVEYYGNELLEQRTPLVMTKLYELEGELRLVAFKNSPKKPMESEFINSLSEKSKSAIAFVLSKEK